MVWLVKTAGDFRLFRNCFSGNSRLEFRTASLLATLMFNRSTLWDFVEFAFSTVSRHSSRTRRWASGLLINISSFSALFCLNFSFLLIFSDLLSFLPSNVWLYLWSSQWNPQCGSQNAAHRFRAMPIGLFHWTCICFGLLFYDRTFIVALFKKFDRINRFAGWRQNLKMPFWPGGSWREHRNSNIRRSWNSDSRFNWISIWLSLWIPLSLLIKKFIINLFA